MARGFLIPDTANAGNFPSGLSVLSAATTSDLTVVDAGGGVAYMEYSGGGTFSRDMFSIDAAGTGITDSEVYLEYEIDGSADRPLGMLCAQSSEDTWYQAGYHGAEGHEINERVTGSLSELDAEAYAPSLNTRLAVRVRIEFGGGDAVLKSKVWTLGDPEPEYQLVTTDTTPRSAGLMGFGFVQDGTANPRIYYVGWATGGDYAPSRDNKFGQSFEFVDAATDVLAYESWSPNTEKNLVLESDPNSFKGVRAGFGNNATTSARKYAKWLECPDTDNVDVVWEFQVDVNQNEFDVYVAGQDSEQTVYIFRVNPEDTTPNISIAKVITGGATTDIQSANFTFTSGVYYLARGNWNAATGDLEFTLWDKDSTEPSTPTVTANNTEITTAGSVGIISFFGDATYKVGYIAYGLDGVAADIPNYSANTPEQFFWTAEDYTVGTTPTDAFQNDVNISSFQIEQDGSGNKYMAVKGPGGTRAFLRYIKDLSSYPSYVELWAKVATTESSLDCFIGVRGFSTTTTTDITTLRGDWAAPDSRIAVYDNGNFNSLSSTTNPIPTDGTIGEYRLLGNGSDVDLTVWQSANSEPGTPTLSTTTTITGGGVIGIGTYRVGTDSFRIYSIGIGTNGAAAPTEPLSTATTVSVSESIVSNDTLQETSTATPILNEPSNANDVIQSSALTSLNVIESIISNDSIQESAMVPTETLVSTNPQESFADRATIRSSVSELTTAQDSDADTANASNNVNESSTTNEIKAALANASEALSEAITAGESWASDVIAAVNTVDSTNVNDLYERTLVLSNSITESSATASQFIASVKFVTSLTESASTQDTLTVFASLLSAVQETLATSGDFTAIANQSLSVLEQASTDSVWASFVTKYTTQIVESVSANDLYQATAYVRSQLNEPVSIGDTFTFPTDLNDDIYIKFAAVTLTTMLRSESADIEPSMKAEGTKINPKN